MNSGTSRDVERSVRLPEAAGPQLLRMITVMEAAYQGEQGRYCFPAVATAARLVKLHVPGLRTRALAVRPAAVVDWVHQDVMGIDLMIQPGRENVPAHVVLEMTDRKRRQKVFDVAGSQFAMATGLPLPPMDVLLPASTSGNGLPEIADLVGNVDDRYAMAYALTPERQMLAEVICSRSHVRGLAEALFRDERGPIDIAIPAMVGWK